MERSGHEPTDLHRESEHTAVSRDGNRLLRGLLAAPLVCRTAGRRLLTVYVVGRRSGRHYAVPVAYSRHDGRLLVGSQFSWVRNLRTGDPVQIRLLGKRRTADVEILTGERDVVEHFATMARDNHQIRQVQQDRIRRAW